MLVFSGRVCWILSWKPCLCWRGDAFVSPRAFRPPGRSATLTNVVSLLRTFFELHSIEVAEGTAGTVVGAG
eukprot:scaffold8361_cov248-Pinguiococcus_pyrenoidosus.AAC.2